LYERTSSPSKQHWPKYRNHLFGDPIARSVCEETTWRLILF
jgi:hypothetical protein